MKAPTTEIGALMVNVRADPEADMVRLEIGVKQATMSMPPEEAIHLAQALTENAEAIKKRRTKN